MDHNLVCHVLYREDGIPCVHTLVFNEGNLHFEDFHPRWFILTLSGQHDNVVIPTCGSGPVYTGPLVRVEIDKKMTQLPYTCHDEDGHDVSPGSDIDEEETGCTDQDDTGDNSQRMESFYATSIAAFKDLLQQATRLPGTCNISTHPTIPCGAFLSFS